MRSCTQTLLLLLLGVSPALGGGHRVFGVLAVFLRLLLFALLIGRDKW